MRKLGVELRIKKTELRIKKIEFRGMMGQSKSFTDLIIWQKAHKFVLNVYELTKDFPKSELYGLTSQLRRAAVSI